MKTISWKNCIRVGVTVVLVYLACTNWQPLIGLLKMVMGAAGPLFIGAAIGYVVNILMCFFERNIFPKCKKPLWDKLRRPVCMLLSFALVVLSIVWMLNTVLPELARSVDMIIASLPGALADGYAWLDEKLDLTNLLREYGVQITANFDWKGAVEKGFSFVIGGVGGVMGAAVTVLSSTVSLVVTLFLATVFAIYLLSGKETLAQQTRKISSTYLGEKLTNQVFYVLATVNDSFHSFIVGQCLEALILGSLCFLGMMVFGFANPLTISVVVGFTALIPIAGSYVGAAVGAFMLFVESPLSALLFVLFLTILQQIEGNLIFPRVVGSSIGLPGIWVLAAVTIGGGVAGILGMLIGVPLVSAVYRLVGRDITAREKGISVFDVSPEPKRKNVLFK